MSRTFLELKTSTKLTLFSFSILLITYAEGYMIPQKPRYYSNVNDRIRKKNSLLQELSYKSSKSQVKKDEDSLVNLKMDIGSDIHMRGSNLGNALIGRENGRRRRAARSVTSFISTFPLFSKSTDANTENSKSIKTISMLEQENEILRRSVSYLEKQNKALEQRQAKQRIIVEQFEGEGMPLVDVTGVPIDPTWWDDVKLGANDTDSNISYSLVPQSFTEESTTILPGSCDDIDDSECPIEPEISFKDALKDRAFWLVGLLTLQSMSGFILARNEQLLQAHPVIIYFLTMLVGAGGNAGNQAAVRVIRGIALGTLNERTQRRFLNREFKMALSLSVILSFAGFIRAALFRTPFPETIAVTSALAIIVFTSICFGAILPLLLRSINIDPAHSSTTIQVIMDILGVVLTVFVSTTLLDSPLGQQIISKLAWGG